MKTVLVLFGGKSSEYKVSLSSATGVLSNINYNKYNVLCAGITKDGRFFLYDGDLKKIADDTWDEAEKYPLFIDLSTGTAVVSRESGCEHIKIDAVLPMVHGKNCEDGTLQGFFAIAGIPIVGCDCASSAVCMDKAITKAIVMHETGIPQAKCLVIKAADLTGEESIDAIRKKCEDKFSYPMFIKPSKAGSSVGTSKVRTPEAFADALKKALAEDTKALVEEYIKGREMEVAVLEENGKYTVAHPAEIDIGTSDFYDYETKYISDVSSFSIPAKIPDDKQREIMNCAETIFKTLDCRGLARVDFFFTPDGKFVFNEINTLPGFTPISMYPKMMIHEGISYSELIDRLIETAK